MDIKTLVKITSRAWALEILALMHSGAAGRQAPLLALTGASRTAFTHSLVHLVNLDLLERTPGHGHPLRPEYRLTSKGKEMANMADKITAVVPGDAGFSLLRRTWTIPVLTVTFAPRYFTEIKSDLSLITDRALSKSLDQLQELKWLRREIDIAGHPPRPTYRAANIGLKISKVVNFSS